MFGYAVRVTGTIDEFSINEVFMFASMKADDLIKRVRDCSSKGEFLQVTDSKGNNLVINFSRIRYVNLNITDVTS